jgi:hypothetical protein
MTMVVIGFDRYNVIVKGFSGAKITGGKAAGILFVIWTYSILGCFPPFVGWGGYALGKHFKILIKLLTLLFVVDMVNCFYIFYNILEAVFDR